VKSLKVTQGKPNPTGKDRLGSATPNSQLVGEWMDIKNSGTEDYLMAGIALQHVAYTAGYPNGIWTNVLNFTEGTLEVGKVVRIHSGSKPDFLSWEDQSGADFHVYTNGDYVWNNDKSDRPRIVSGGSDSVIDETMYDAYPPEGEILKRIGNKLE